ncbi:tetratricopeptide repeat protein [Candidatus Binatia bacterium]|jgi:tetratricopeptide (TPR) repeat protein|nr:tetratricopeptide repeat protein [Candidatus Binatia bacterium]
MRRPLWNLRSGQRIALRRVVVAVALLTVPAPVRAESPAKTHVDAGLRHVEAGRADEAFAEAQQGIAADPGSADAYDVLGAAHYLRHEYEAALAAHRRASELAPGSSDPHDNMVPSYWALGRNDDALREARMALTLEPDCGHCRISLASTLYRLGRYDEAAAESRTALRTAPEAPDAQYVLGATLVKLDDARSAIAPLRACIRLATPEQRALADECRYLLGSAHLKVGEPRPAEDIFRRLVEDEPDGTRARVGLADALVSQSRFADAAVELETAVRTTPTSSWISYRLGVVYGRLRRSADAVTQLEASVAGDPSNAFAVAALVRAYAAAGRVDDAAARYEALKKLDPTLAARIGGGSESCKAQNDPEA